MAVPLHRCVVRCGTFLALRGALIGLSSLRHLRHLNHFHLVSNGPSALGNGYFMHVPTPHRPYRLFNGDLMSSFILLSTAN